MPHFHLFQRNVKWYYRRRVPVGCQDEYGSVVQFSLNTTSLPAAKARRSELDVEYDRKFGLSKSPSPDPQIRNRSDAVAAVQHARSERKGKLESDFSAQFLSSARRQELIEEAEQELSWIEDDDSQDGQEMVGRAHRQVFGDVDSGVETLTAELARRLLAELRRDELRLLTGTPGGFVDPLFNEKTSSPTFGQLTRAYLEKRATEDQARRLTHRTTVKVNAQVRLVEELVGLDTPLSELTYEHLESCRNRLSRVPTNHSKLFPGSNLLDVLAHQKQGTLPTLSLTTQNDYWAILSQILELGVAKGQLKSNPSAALRPLGRDDRHSSERRASFTLEQLKQLFLCKFYQGVASGEMTAANTKGLDWRFWGPPLALFHGLRGREAFQLQPADIAETTAGTWYLHITDQALDPSTMATKSVKNPGSRRRIPVHPELIKMGFLDFVTRRKKQKALRLFPTLKEHGGNPSVYALKRFNTAFLPAAFEVGQKQSFHSFRHCFRDALRRIDAPPSIVAVAGWKGPHSVSDDYGSEQDNPDLTKEWTHKVSFPGVSLEHLAGRGSSL